MFFHGSVFTLLRFCLTVVLGLRCTLKTMRSVRLCHLRFNNKKRTVVDEFRRHQWYIQVVSSSKRCGWSALLVWACPFAPCLQKTCFAHINVQNPKCLSWRTSGESVGTKRFHRRCLEGRDTSLRELLVGLNKANAERHDFWMQGTWTQTLARRGAPKSQKTVAILFFER